MIDWEIVDQEWRFLTGWPDVRSSEPGKMALRIKSHMFGLGGAISAFEGPVEPPDHLCGDPGR